MGEITWVTCLFDIRSKENMTKKVPYVKLSDEYLIYGEFTMALDVPLIIYIDKKYEAYCIEKRKDKMNKTQIITMDFEDLPYYSYFDDIKKIHSNINNPSQKDTILYVILTWSKFSLLKRSMKNNPFNSDYFGWVDFGLIHVYAHHILKQYIAKTESIQLFKSMAVEYNKVFNIKYDKLHILNVLPCVVNGDAEYTHHNTDDSIINSMACGFFTGHKNIISIIIDLFERYSEKYMVKKCYILEEKILTHIYIDIPELFDVYHGYYSGILANSIQFTYDLSFLTSHLIHFRKQNNWNKNIEICEPIFESFKNNHFENENQIYCSKFLDEYYLACFYTDKNKALEVAKFYAKRVTTNEKFKNAFEDNETHIRKNFSYLHVCVFQDI